MVRYLEATRRRRVACIISRPIERHNWGTGRLDVGTLALHDDDCRCNADNRGTGQQDTMQAYTRITLFLRLLY